MNHVNENDNNDNVFRGFAWQSIQLFSVLTIIVIFFGKALSSLDN